MSRSGGVVCEAGDYHLARAGMEHDWVRTDAGCLLFIRGAPAGPGTTVAGWGQV